MKKYLLLFIFFCSFFLVGFSYENELVEEQIDFWEPKKISRNLSEETVEILYYLGLDELNLENIYELSFDDFAKFLLKVSLTK